MKLFWSLLVTAVLLAFPAISLAQYGGASSSIGSSLSKDVCPNGDNSGSYYDNTCGSSSSGDSETTDTTDDEDTGVTLDGHVFFDENKSGFMDGGEVGVQGAVVTLKTTGNSILETDVTNSNGYYAFYNVGPGTYKVHVSLPATKKSFVESLLSLIVPEVYAASDYEFTVVVGEDDSGVLPAGDVPIVDGEATGVTIPTTSSVTTDNDDTTTDSSDDDSSILDLIKNSNKETTSTVSSVPSGNGGFTLPTALPNTGANA